MQLLLAQIHYMPDHWKGAAHTQKIRSEFAELFQYKAVSELQPVFSALYRACICLGCAKSSGCVSGDVLKGCV